MNLIVGNLPFSITPYFQMNTNLSEKSMGMLVACLLKSCFYLNEVQGLELVFWHWHRQHWVYTASNLYNGSWVCTCLCVSRYNGQTLGLKRWKLTGFTPGTLGMVLSPNFWGTTIPGEEKQFKFLIQKKSLKKLIISWEYSREIIRHKKSLQKL